MIGKVIFLVAIVLQLCDSQLFGPFGNYPPGLLNYLGIPPFPFVGPQTRGAGGFGYPPMDYYYAPSFYPSLPPRKPFTSYEKTFSPVAAASFERPLMTRFLNDESSFYPYYSKPNRNNSPHRERHINSYKPPFTASSIGQYAALLKAILGQSSSQPVPSYSHDVPSAKTSVLGNDYSSLNILPQRSAYRPEVDPYWLTEKVDLYNSKTFEEPAVIEKKMTFPAYIPYVDPKLELINPMETRLVPARPETFFEKPPYPDWRIFDPATYMDKRYPPPYSGGNYDGYQQERRQIHNLYDVPNYFGVGSKPGPAYSSSFSPPPPADQDPSPYEYDTGNYQPPKRLKLNANAATYFPGARDRQEFQKDAGYLDQKAIPRQTSIESNPSHIIKYPTLGYEADAKKQMPATIAALFGAGKYGEYADPYDRTAAKNTHEPRSGPSSGPSAAGLEDNNPSPKLAALPIGNTPAVDIFVPAGRSSVKLYPESSKPAAKQ